MDRVLIRNLLSMTAWQAGNYLIPLITLPYLARILDVRAFGQLGLSVAVVAYCLLLSDWGFNLSATREIARHHDDPARISSIFWNTMAAKTCLAIVSLAFLSVAVTAVPALREIWPVLLAAWLAVPSAILTANWFLQGMEKMGSFAIASILGRAAMIPLTFLLVRSPSDVWIAAALQAGGGLVGGLISTWLIGRLRLVGPPDISFAGIRAQMSSGWLLFLTSAAVNLYTTTNTVILGMVAGPVAVGFFSGADRIRTAAQATTSPISQVVFPRLSHLMNRDRSLGLKLARSLLLAQGAITLLISTLLFLNAETLVQIILGPGYFASVSVLRWLAWLPFIVGLNNVFALNVLVAIGHDALVSNILVVIAPLSLIAVVLAATYAGSNGVAATAVIVEIVVTVAALIAVLVLRIPLFSTSPSKGPARVLHGPSNRSVS